MNCIEQMENIQKVALEMFNKKSQDYGDAFAKFGVIGILIRIEDKIQRALSITKNGITMLNDESIRDTLIDLHDYLAMGVMLLDEKKINQKFMNQIYLINYIKCSR